MPQTGSGQQQCVGRLMFHIVGAVAEFEHALIRGRIAMGMAEARRRGKHIGRPPLKKFSEAELEQIRAERKRKGSIRQLAIRFGTSQWMVKGSSGSGRQGRETVTFLDSSRWRLRTVGPVELADRSKEPFKNASNPY